MIANRSNLPTAATGASLNPAIFLALIEGILADFPLGLIVLDSSGHPLWCNREAHLACNVWNQRPKGADALPLERQASPIPASIWSACQSLRSDDDHPRQVEIVSDHDRGLFARIHSHAIDGERLFFVRLDYRRPRSDRDRAMSVEAVSLLAQLTPREREVALRVREGLPTVQIAKELCRSPLTIKTQLASVFRKLGLSSRARLAAILNR